MDEIKILTKLFKQAVAWNSGEALFYQVVFLLHQLALFSSSTPEFYGIQGGFFASVFLLVQLFNFSFDTAVTPLFKQLITSKREFKSFLVPHLIRQVLVLWCGTLLACIGAYYYIPAVLNHYGMRPFWIVLVSFLVASEGTKKNLRALLHLGFQSKRTAYIEMLNITFYVAGVWVLIGSGFTISLMTLVLPFIGISFLTNLFLLHELQRYYSTLPSIMASKQAIEARFTHDRIALYMNELGHFCFSSNFLVALFTTTLDTQLAGAAVLAHNISRSGTFLLQKVFGPSGGALFAQMHDYSISDKQLFFSLFNRYTLYAMAAIMTVSTIGGSYYYSTVTHGWSYTVWLLFFTFFIAQFFESIFMVYERLFIAHRQSMYLLIWNIASLVCCYIAYEYIAKNSLLAFFTCCMLIRLATFCGITISAKKLWGIRFTLR